MCRATEEEAARKEKGSRKKNLGLLSFGEEAEEEAEDEDVAPTKAKMVSAHDVLEDDRRAHSPASDNPWLCARILWAKGLKL